MPVLLLMASCLRKRSKIRVGEVLRVARFIALAAT